MKKYFDVMRRCPLFAGIAEEDMESLLSCLNAKEIKVKKGAVIFHAGDRPDYVGIVLQGNAHVVQEDYWGNRTILTDVQESDMFGEAFSCGEVAALPVSVIAQEEGVFLLVDSRRILTSCSSACIFHARLIRNLMKVIANKNILLTRKMEHITKRTTKEKVLSYLSACAIAKGSNSFTISFNRQEFADYLSVERSALSNTLCKMRDDGIIQFDKNKFVLMKTPQ